MVRKMCWTSMEPTQELQGGSAAMRKRTALVTLGSMQAGLGSLDTMPSVPLGGLEMNVTQVLQPASAKTKSGATGNRRLQQLRQIVRVFLAEVSPIRHLRTGGNSGRNVFYAEVEAAATERPLQASVHQHLWERRPLRTLRLRSEQAAAATKARGRGKPLPHKGGAMQPEGGRYGILFRGEDFGVGGFGGGGSGNHVERRVDFFGYRGEADFGAAGLVSQFHGNVLGAERGGGKNG